PGRRRVRRRATAAGNVRAIARRGVEVPRADVVKGFRVRGSGFSKFWSLIPVPCSGARRPVRSRLFLVLFLNPEPRTLNPLMPNLDFTVECPVFDSFRVQQVAGMFDVPLAQKSAQRFSVELPARDEPWQIGLVVGPSGSGK